jgi:glycosyltransferase involved in cell wall biosynthesis
MTTPSRDRVVVVTIGLTGNDGASELSRPCVEAFVPRARAGDIDLDVWSLEDSARPAWLADVPAGFRTAQGSRMVFGSFGLRPGAIDAQTMFIVMHVHLLPVLLPVLYRGARVALWLLGIEAWTPLRGMAVRALRQCWRVLAISQYTVDRFRLANPSLASVPVRVCAPRVPDAAPADREPAPSGVGENARPFALIVGRMAAAERYKGHDELIDLWQRVRHEVPAMRLVIAGGGDDETRLRQKVQRLGLEGEIEFAGHVSAGRLAALYRDARFFVMPSRDEGFGLVFLEAMRAGKPCIASPGAAEEIIEPDRHGFIVDSSDDAALLSAILRLSSDDELCRRMGAAAAARVASQFSAARFRDRMYASLDVRAVPVAC